MDTNQTSGAKVGEDKVEFSKKPLLYPGRIVNIEGMQFRITEYKPNGRLFLKAVK